MNVVLQSRISSYVRQGGSSRREELHSEFCSVFLLIFFRAFALWGDRASSRVLVLRFFLALRRRP